MKPCVVGIGGAGGNILKQFLQNMDISLLGGFNFGEMLAYGEVKGLWLESATQDVQDQNFYGSLVQGLYPPYLICHEAVGEGSSTRGYVIKEYGFDLKAPGFDRRAEYLKGIFEVFESDSVLQTTCSEEFPKYRNPLADYIWKAGIRDFTIISMSKALDRSRKLKSSRKGRKDAKLCDSILFLASLGGGTGTGFINPITSFVRSDEPIFPIFALGILTEQGPDKRHAREEQRYLGATIAMYDLLTKESGKGIDGLLLMDNQILKERFEGNYSDMDAHIYGALKPLFDMRNYPGDKLQDDAPALRRVFWEVDREDDLERGKNGNFSAESDEINEKKELLPPILVPCYHIQPDNIGDIDTLIEGALGIGGSTAELGKDGRLFPCNPTRAERALVFTRGFFKISEIMEAVQHRTELPIEKIKIYRKLGDSKNEDILILLRNPYGGEPGMHERQGTLEWRMHDIISKSIDYIEDEEINILGFQSYTDRTKDAMRNYFCGKDGLKDELKRCLDRLENGEKPIFRRPLRIFEEGDVFNAGNEKYQINKEAIESNKNEMRALIKSEFNRLIISDQFKDIIKEIVKS